MRDCVRVIRHAFATLKRQLGITKDNCPTHPAFITTDEVRQLRRDGCVLFGLYDGGRQVGFVAVKDRGDGCWYMARLAVLPAFRHRGFGGRLMDFVFDYVKAKGGDAVLIATVDQNAALKNWYLEYGFTITEVRRFDHLPFAVCFMEKIVE